MKLLDDPPLSGAPSCFGRGESGLAEESPGAPAPEGCCARAIAGMARARSHKARTRVETSGVRSAIFGNMNAPWISAVELNVVTCLGPQAFRILPDSPFKQGRCQVMRFTPIKTKRPVCTMMPDADVLMRDVEATYHGRARPATGSVE